MWALWWLYKHKVIVYIQGSKIVPRADQCCDHCEEIGCVVNGTVYKVNSTIYVRETFNIKGRFRYINQIYDDCTFNDGWERILSRYSNIRFSLYKYFRIFDCETLDSNVRTYEFRNKELFMFATKTTINRIVYASLKQME